MRMEQNVFFTFSLIIEGATVKVFQFLMPLRSVCYKTFGFIEEKCISEYYNTTERFKQENYLKLYYTLAEVPGVARDQM